MNRLLAAAAAAVAGVAFAMLILPQVIGGNHEYIGTVLSSPELAPEFSLIADNGERVGLDAYDGQVVLVYFGYTFCPDICPATLAELADTVSLLGSDAGDVQVAMISVDPARDTPEVLGNYVDHFDESFVGLTGSEAEILAVAESYNVYFAKSEETTATGYLVDHWSGVMLIDRDGLLVEMFSYGTSSEDMAADIKAWL